MTYFVVCSFDLVNCGYKEYLNAYADLAAIGLKRDIASSYGDHVRLPTTTIAGEFDGKSPGQVRDDLYVKIHNVFSKRGFKSQIFISVCRDWSWGHGMT